MIRRPPRPTLFPGAALFRSIVTEQGLADLRGLTAYERAHVLIENCAHPKFRPGLREYVEQAYAQSKAKHGIIRL